LPIFKLHNRNIKFSDYCCWFTANNKSEKYLDYDETPEKTQLKLSLTDAYYKTYKFTSFDLILDTKNARKPIDAINRIAKTDSSSNIIGGMFGKKKTPQQSIP